MDKMAVLNHQNYMITWILQILHLILSKNVQHICHRKIIKKPVDLRKSASEGWQGQDLNKLQF